MGVTPISVQTLSGLPNNFSASGLTNTIFTHAHFSVSDNTSGFAIISVAADNDESKELKAEVDGDKDRVNGNFSTVQETVLAGQSSSEKLLVAESSEKVYDEKIKGISRGKTEVSSSGEIAEENEVTSIGKIEAPRAEGTGGKRAIATSVENGHKITSKVRFSNSSEEMGIICKITVEGRGVSGN